MTTVQDLANHSSCGTDPPSEPLIQAPDFPKFLRGAPHPCRYYIRIGQICEMSYLGKNVERYGACPTSYYTQAIFRKNAETLYSKHSAPGDRLDITVQFR